MGAGRRPTQRNLCFATSARVGGRKRRQRACTGFGSIVLFSSSPAYHNRGLSEAGTEGGLSPNTRHSPKKLNVCSRDGFQMAAGWMRAGFLRPGRSLKPITNPEIEARETDFCIISRVRKLSPIAAQVRSKPQPNQTRKKVCRNAPDLCLAKPRGRSLCRR